MAQPDNIGPLIGRGYYAEVFAYGDGKVVKLFDDGRDMDSAEHEARLTTVARESGIPAPKIYDVVTVDECAGIVMERIDGENDDPVGHVLALACLYRCQADGPPARGHALQARRGHSRAA